MNGQGPPDSEKYATSLKKKDKFMKKNENSGNRVKKRGTNRKKAAILGRIFYFTHLEKLVAH